MSNHFSQAEEALREKRFDDAVELFTKALEADDTNADAYLGRAKSHNKLENSLEAAADAQQATTLNPKLAPAHYEQGRALYDLDEFESAKQAFEMASTLEPTKKVYKNWVGMCLAALGQEVPIIEDPSPAPAQQQAQNQEQKRHIQQRNPEATSVRVDDPEYAKYWNIKSAPVGMTSSQTPTPLQKYVHHWFQSPQKVEVNVMAKGLSKDQVTVDIKPQHLHVTISEKESKNKSEYELDVALHGTVDVAKSNFIVLGTKIEIQLVKADLGQNWPSLEKHGIDASPGGKPLSGVDASDMIPSSSHHNTTTNTTNTTTAAPPPPYTGKAGRVNWDAIVAEENNDTSSSDDVMNFFQKLYMDADEDTKRAMLKSYQESGGTSLSTDWSDVGSKSFKLDKAPDGAEMKKIDY